MLLTLLRMTELGNVIRSMPSTQFDNGEGTMVPAQRGFHGLSLLVHVGPNGCATSQMRDLLHDFTIFRGPLNEVTIVGFEDANFARGFQNGITQPYHHEPFFEKMLLTTWTANKTGNKVVSAGKHSNMPSWFAARYFHTARFLLVTNSFLFDNTPWTEWLDTMRKHVRSSFSSSASRSSTRSYRISRLVRSGKSTGHLK